MCENPLINVGARAVINVFLNSYLDHEPSNLKVELVWDIVIPNNCVKIHLKPVINAGTRAMT